MDRRLMEGENGLSGFRRDFQKCFVGRRLNLRGFWLEDL